MHNQLYLKPYKSLYIKLISFLAPLFSVLLIADRKTLVSLCMGNKFLNDNTLGRILREFSGFLCRVLCKYKLVTFNFTQKMLCFLIILPLTQRTSGIL